MKSRIEKFASQGLVAATLAVAVALAALAMQRDPGTEAVAVARAAAQSAKECPDCYEHPPFNPGFEMPKDMKMAETIETF